MHGCVFMYVRVYMRVHAGVQQAARAGGWGGSPFAASSRHLID